MQAKMITLSSHTVEESILPEEPVVLDVGARNFGWTNALLQIRPKAKVVALEPDPKVQNPLKENVQFLNAALVGDNRTQAMYAGWSTGEGNMLTENRPHYAETFDSVQCINLERLKAFTGHSKFDIIKLDCEGCEFGILENLDQSVADQITVEFHDWDKRSLYPDTYYENLWKRLDQFKVVKHELTPIGPGPAWGHWDSLLVRKTLVS